MLKKITTTFAIVALMASTAIAGSCGSSEKHTHAKEASAKYSEKVQKNIVETAVAAGNFTTLVAAVKAAGLVDALQGEGPLTVFAPTDEAFAALPEGTVEALLEDKDKLASILTYHVAGGKLTADKVTSVDKLETLQGESATLTMADDKVMIDNAQIVMTDIECSNGVIHVIDAVILPDSME